MSDVFCSSSCQKDRLYQSPQFGSNLGLWCPLVEKGRMSRFPSTFGSGEHASNDGWDRPPHAFSSTTASLLHRETLDC